MDWLKNLFTYQWQRKLVALLCAIVIWFFVNHSITDEKVIANVPIRITHLPEDKTVPGIQPNGIIGKRIPLTLIGTKTVIDELEPGDLEIVLDASEIEQNDWVVQIVKKNLVSLNPAIDLSRHIDEISHPMFVLRLSKVTSAKVPVSILPPKGYAPSGYEYLDIWPQKLQHTVVGPQEQVQEILKKGLELEIDMSMISNSDLDRIKTSRDNFHDDEVSFFLPSHWKKIALPIKGGVVEEINDPEAQNLHLDFLRREYLPINQNLIIRPFYPLDTAAKLNPLTAPIQIEGKLKQINKVVYLDLPLFVRDVSPLFLEVVKNNLAITLIVQETEDRLPLHWSLQVIDPHLLEDHYVNTLLAQNAGGVVKNNEPRHTKKREEHLRIRFRHFVQKLALFTSPDKKLHLDARLTEEGISVVPHSL